MAKEQGEVKSKKKRRLSAPLVFLKWKGGLSVASLDDNGGRALGRICRKRLQSHERHGHGDAGIRAVINVAAAILDAG